MMDILKYGAFIVGGIIFVAAVELIAMASTGHFNIIIQILGR